MSLVARRLLPEQLNNDDVDPAHYQRCLDELALINRITLTHRPTLRWLDRAAEQMPAGATVSVLDVACGQGDLLRAIAHRARRRGLNTRLSGIDINPRSTAAARNATPRWMDVDYHTSDVFSYIPAVRPDFIVSSQFAHHLNDEDIVKFLVWLDGNTRRGWHIADLHRHALAYYGFRALARLMGWHRITRYDGAISVARGFRRQDWRRYLDAAGLRAGISWHMGFRFCVSRTK